MPGNNSRYSKKALSIGYVPIEDTLKILLGLDCGVTMDDFRTVDPSSMGILLKNVSTEISRRTSKIEFEEWESQSGEPKIRLDVALKNLSDIGDAMGNLEEFELNDYHWNIVGVLLQVIASILDHLEGNKSPMPYYNIEE